MSVTNGQHDLTDNSHFAQTNLSLSLFACDKAADHTFRIADQPGTQVAAQRWFGLRVCVGSEDVLGHDGDPLRVNSIRFFPRSTYPLSMIFGMMYVPSRRS
jgi:hypothetical protein